MLEQIRLDRTLYTDIETAACAPNLAAADPALQAQWKEKFQWRLKEGETLESKFEEEAGLNAAWSRVVCVVLGKLVPKGAGGFELHLETYDNADERELLQALSDYMCSLPADVKICGHNLKGFDAPVLCRRMLVHGIKIPSKLWEYDRKPWENPQIDTMEIWKFGEHQGFIKLELLSHLLGIPSSKDDISGPGVSKAYWAGELPRIVKYCLKDVAVLASIMLRMKGEQTLAADDVRVNKQGGSHD